MDYKVKLKLGNINNLSDARFAAAAGIDYMGFCFDASHPSYITPVKAQQIIEWTTGCFIVAEFGLQSLSEITDIVELLGIDVVELNNNLAPDELLAIGKPIIKKIDIGALSPEALEATFRLYAEKVDAFHLYTQESSYVHTEEALKTYCATYKIIWGITLQAANIQNMLATYKPFALNIAGSDEEKTGLKDFDELNNLLDALGMLEG